MLQDARNVAADRQTARVPAMWKFIGQLAYEFRRNAPLLTQAVVLSLLILLIGVVGGLAYYNSATQRADQEHLAALFKELEASRLSEAELIRRTHEERQRIAEALAAHEAETNRVLALLEAQRQKGLRNRRSKHWPNGSRSSKPNG